MSWSSRRQALYITGVVLFFGTLIGVPLAMWWYEPATCFDRKLNGGETALDKGGPCVLLDERALIPHAVQWARSFPVRGGLWAAVAYIENPNESGGVRQVPYRFRLYDERNVLVAERQGATFIMPGAVTPIYEGGIETGNRSIGRTFFEFGSPLVWERMRSDAEAVIVTGKTISGERAEPRVEAFAENTSVADIRDARFVAVIFDPQGNAIAASHTVIPVFRPGTREEIVFTWPDPIEGPVGRVDVIPLAAPTLADEDSFSF